MRKRKMTLLEVSKLKPNFREIERLAGLYPNTISQYILGSKIPSEVQLAKINDALNQYGGGLAGIILINEKK